MMTAAQHGANKGWRCYDLLPFGSYRVRIYDSESDEKDQGKAKADIATDSANLKAKGTKAQGKGSRTTQADAKRDRFGFLAGRKIAQAATLYSRAEGATRAEIVKALDAPHMSMLKEAEGRGFTVTKQTRAAV